MKARYYIYRNLRTNTFSLRYRSRVIAHPSELVLINVRFSVSEMGRQRVLDSKRKNVHATVNGESTRELLPTDNLGSEIYYNPYITPYFTSNGKPIHSAEIVICKNNKLYLPAKDADDLNERTT